ncbi:hypothetical protein WJX84_011517 [Apatococcus fuscideae]|uniref:Uncharacterized protein n=1 Tax=Apatococcus fuscideae TaxID=2026836 RepID=A0AAW1SQ04_9CHLO
MLPEIPGGVPTHVAPQEDFGGQRDRACSQEAASGFKEPHTDENDPSQSSLDNIVLLDIEQCAGLQKQHPCSHQMDYERLADHPGTNEFAVACLHRGDHLQCLHVQSPACTQQDALPADLPALLLWVWEPSKRDQIEHSSTPVAVFTVMAAHVQNES